MVSKQPQDAPSADAAPNAQFMTPFGRELVVSAIKGTALYCINYRDGKGGYLPEAYAGRYTKPDYAAEDLKLCLKEMRQAFQAIQDQNSTVPEHLVQSPVLQVEVASTELPPVEKKRRGRPPKIAA